MQVKLVQHAVGQGGLHFGQLGTAQHSLRWVYDCGSNQRDALQREICALASHGDLDVIFLSHLDSDHISGVDLLLTQIKVREVVLPYLNDEARIAAIARDAVHGRLTGLFIEALNGLADWFGSRGVELVTMVDGSGGGEIVALTDPADPIAPVSEDSPVRTTWRGTETDQSGAGKQVAATRRVRNGGAFCTEAGSSQLNWVLIPYVHEPPPRLVKAFGEALDAAFKGTGRTEIAQEAKHPEQREKLRDCYEEIWADHNLVSMTLYVGTIVPRKTAVDLRFDWRSHRPWLGPGLTDGAGWMLTGDANLSIPRRRKKFLHFYREFLPQAGVFMLPHHGSRNNHSDEVLNSLQNLLLAFASAGPNSYGHPHREVQQAVRKRFVGNFHRVDHRQVNEIVCQIDLTGKWR